MLSVTGIYDSGCIFLTEPVREQKKYKVIVTFVEELESAEPGGLDMRSFGAKNISLEYLNNPKEDIYQDYAEKSAAE